MKNSYSRAFIWLIASLDEPSHSLQLNAQSRPSTHRQPQWPRQPTEPDRVVMVCGLKADSALWRFEGAALIQVDEQREARKDNHHHEQGHNRQQNLGAKGRR